LKQKLLQYTYHIGKINWRLRGFLLDTPICSLQERKDDIRDSQSVVVVGIFFEGRQDKGVS
jgi:hypothetical protein